MDPYFSTTHPFITIEWGGTLYRIRKIFMLDVLPLYGNIMS